MSIFWHWFQNRFFGYIPVMEGSLMTTGGPWVLGQISPYLYVQSLPHPQARPKLGLFLTFFTSLSCVRVISGMLLLPFQESFWLPTYQSVWFWSCLQCFQWDLKQVTAYNVSICLLTPKNLIFLWGKSTFCILLHGKALLMSQCDKMSCISYTILNYVYTTIKIHYLECLSETYQAPVVQKVDSAIQRMSINKI